MQYSRPLHARIAFTLVEVMVAVSVFSFVLLTSMSMVIMETNIIRRTRERIYVNRLLESRMEEVRDLTFEEFEEVVSSYGTAFSFEVDPAKTILGTTIETDQDTQEFDFPLAGSLGLVSILQVEPNLYRITITIEWKVTGANRETTMNTTSLVTRNGVGRR